MAALESAKEQAMSAVEIDASLIRALQARARKERTTVDRLVRRLIADSLQELEDHEAVKAFRASPGRTVPLADVRKSILGRAKRRRSKAFLAEVRRQCRLANQSDRRDNRQR